MIKYLPAQGVESKMEKGFSGYQKLGTLKERFFDVPESRIFMHPTRLTSAWQPKILEVVQHGYTISRPQIEVGVNLASSEVLGIKVKSRLRRLYRYYANPLEFDKTPILDARYETDNNIAHLLTLVLPKILAFKQFQPKVTVVLRKNASKMGRAFFSALRIPVLCTDRFVIGNLIQTNETVQGAFEGWYQDLFRNLTFEGQVSDTPKRVFLARKGQRRLINERDVEDLLTRYGFRKVYFEEISIGEQWSWIRNATEVVAVHGAGMGALLFGRPNLKVVELFHAGFVNDIYRNMIAAMGGHWCAITGKITEDTVAKLDFGQNPHAVAMDSFEIDLSTLERALNLMRIQASG